MAKKTNEPTNAEPKAITPKKLLSKIVRVFASENFDLTSLLGEEIAVEVASFYDSIKSKGIRNLPLTEQLALCDGEIESLFAEMPERGSADWNTWNSSTLKAMQRKARLEKKITNGEV